MALTFPDVKLIELNYADPPKLRPPPKQIGTAPAMSREVWSAEQTFTVDAKGGLSADDMPDFKGPHPLIELTDASNTNGVALVTLDLTFVDVTEFFKAYQRPDDAQEYKDDHKEKVEWRALGFTPGNPLIWHVSIPEACTSASKMGCLVFFRPSNQQYQRLDQLQDEYGELVRYLLAPMTLDAEVVKHVLRLDLARRSDRLSLVGVDGEPRLFDLLRSGFEQALARSKKKVIILQPWPMNVSFGAAASSDLPDHCDAVLNLLWAKQLVGKGQSEATRRRLGIAGFSAGRHALWSTLDLNLDDVDEVYAFDAGDYRAGRVIDWFKGAATKTQPAGRKRKLRLTGSPLADRSQVPIVTRNAAVKSAIGSTNADVTAEPADVVDYRAPGINLKWDYVLSGLDALATAAKEKTESALGRAASARVTSSPGTAASPRRIRRDHRSSRRS